MLLFVDIETTGFEKEDKICSMGVHLFEASVYKESFYELFNEGKKIPPKASALHNITNEMIANAATFLESDLYRVLQEHNKEEHTLVVHNSSFVLGYLEATGLRWRGTIIDTQRVVKHAIPECEIFSLEFLRYELKLYQNEEKYKALCGIKSALITHNALHDALIVKILYDFLKEEHSADEMERMSFESVLLEKFPFGKYQGRYIEEIVQIDRAYLHWLLSLEDLDSDLRYSIEYYLEG